MGTEVTLAERGPWPWVCETCGERYAGFWVHARWGPRFGEVGEWTVCKECGPEVPPHVQPPRSGWLDVWPTIIRPVPESFDPKTNPYPRTKTNARTKRTGKEIDDTDTTDDN